MYRKHNIRWREIKKLTRENAADAEKTIFSLLSCVFNFFHIYQKLAVVHTKALRSDYRGRINQASGNIKVWLSTNSQFHHNLGT